MITTFPNVFIQLLLQCKVRLPTVLRCDYDTGTLLTFQRGWIVPLVTTCQQNCFSVKALALHCALALWRNTQIYRATHVYIFYSSKHTPGPLSLGISFCPWVHRHAEAFYHSTTAIFFFLANWSKNTATFLPHVVVSLYVVIYNTY